MAVDPLPGVRPHGVSAVREPVVSALLPTQLPWPALADALHSLFAQVDAPAFEILVLDGCGDALPDEPQDPAVRWIRMPGRDSFALRAAGVAQARGEIVAVTEDHCIAPADWVASIAEAHRSDPAPAIVGAIGNHPQSDVSPLDRANFLLTFAGQTRNRLSLRLGRLPVPTNLSFKRSAMPLSGLPPGALEYAWLAELQKKKSLGVAKSVLLHHRQSWGRATFAVHFASGRSYGAVVHAASPRTRIGWWLRFPLLPARLVRLVAPDLAHAPRASEIGCAMLLIATNVCGQAAGALFGAGASRHRL